MVQAPRVNRSTVLEINRVSTAQGKQGKLEEKNPCQGKHKGFGHFAKTQGVWFAQVADSLISEIKLGETYFNICTEDFPRNV